MAKSFLVKNGVQYQEFNVGEDRAARDEMVRKSGQLGVPLIDIDGELILGFDEAKLKEKLGLS